MRFEVPQFIEIEDKIFGPFTWKQFLFLSGPALAVVLFFTTNIYIFAIIGLPAAGFGFLLAFYPVNNRPFSVFLQAIVEFFGSKKAYVWRRKEKATYRSEQTAAPTAPAPTQSYLPPSAKGNLHSLSRKLELEALQKPEQQ